MKIHFILVVLAAVFCFSIIILSSYLNSEDHTGTTGTVENLEIIVDPANGISNQADSNEESPLLPSIGAFPGNSYSGHNEENIEAEPIEQQNVSSEIQLYAHSNVSSESSEQHNIFSEIQSNAQSNISSEPIKQHNVFFEIQSNAQSNIFFESIEQHNVSSEIQSDAQSNVYSEPIEQHNIFSEIQSYVQSSQLRRRHRPREPNDDVNDRPLVAEHFSATDLLMALGPGRLIFELCAATIHFLNSWWKKIRRWREKIQVSSMVLFRVLGILSSIVGLVCYALSSSFKQLMG